jgi:hypothetical protein
VALIKVLLLGYLVWGNNEHIQRSRSGQEGLDGDAGNRMAGKRMNSFTKLLEERN